MGRSARSLRNSTRLLTLPGQNGFWTCPSGESRRFRQLEPVIRRTFDIPTMVRLSVGPSRANLTEARPRGHGKEGQCRFVHDLYGVFPVKRLFLGFAHRSLFGAGKAVLHPVACDQVSGARGRGQGTETLASLGGFAA